MSRVTSLILALIHDQHAEGQKDMSIKLGEQSVTVLPATTACPIVQDLCDFIVVRAKYVRRPQPLLCGERTRQGAFEDRRAPFPPAFRLLSRGGFATGRIGGTNCPLACSPFWVVC
ncbi:hypothetical protein DIPPA_53831 [Diplonema papillatum]|nr:hypothetical protein DIPPA_53831 [Diplonema papillatum]